MCMHTYINTHTHTSNIHCNETLVWFRVSGQTGPLPRVVSDILLLSESWQACSPAPVGQAPSHATAAHGWGRCWGGPTQSMGSELVSHWWGQPGFCCHCCQWTPMAFSNIFSLILFLLSSPELSPHLNDTYFSHSSQLHSTCVLLTFLEFLLSPPHGPVYFSL